jgi:ferredoxin-fold anticodon binding domain-containing protein
MKTEPTGDKFEKTTKPTVGHKYHLSWANAGCVWTLEQVHPDGIHCFLKTPKTKKMIKAKLADLRLLSKEQSNNTYKPF